ncbi:MAG: histidinol-phosphatase HisJ family protein [Candidatus Hydrogenedentes bacterium]|nr:histidinol-phosphatase HisJ family protein [Candidatus Hydrogenedentota bacterium]
MGWDVQHLEQLFAAYAAELETLQKEYSPKIAILRGFEAEVVPEANYVDVMHAFQRRFKFQYIVGSVHWVNGHIIDYTPEHFAKALAVSGSLEALAIRYYETIVDMARRLQPEVIAHFDLIRRYAPDEGSVSTPPARAAALAALEAVRDVNAILDVNTGGYRKGFARPYPAPWIVEAARDLGIAFCFGDDSHRASEVGAGIEDARQYLLACNIHSITTLRPHPTGLSREEIALA